MAKVARLIATDRNAVSAIALPFFHLDHALLRVGLRTAVGCAEGGIYTELAVRPSWAGKVML